MYWSRCQTSVNQHIDQVETDSGDQQSSMATHSWLTVGQHVCGVSTDSQSACQPAILVDTWPTDALSTHDPCSVAR